MSGNAASKSDEPLETPVSGDVEARTEILRRAQVCEDAAAPAGFIKLLKL